MKIDDIRIDDAVDANYVIKKFFGDKAINNSSVTVDVTSLEQLILKVYTMGKKNMGRTVPQPITNKFKLDEKVQVVKNIRYTDNKVLEKGSVGVITDFNKRYYVMTCFDSAEYFVPEEGLVLFEGQETAKTNIAERSTPVVTLKAGDEARVIEDVEIGRSGDIIKAGTIGRVDSHILKTEKGDAITFIFESDESGEMISTAVLVAKLEKV
jgi:uncharacterized Zn ribbon protein